MGKRTFGSVRKLPSGRLQARYTGPDGATYTARTPQGRALTFDSVQYADRYLARVSADIQAGRWVSPTASEVKVNAPPSLSSYAETWLAGRDLADRTGSCTGSCSMRTSSRRSVARRYRASPRPWCGSGTRN